MPVIYIDGPEKAGKSTLVQALVEAIPNAKVRKFTGPMVDDEYMLALEEDSQPSLFPLITIWDRGWASEYVYSKLMGRVTELDDIRASALDCYLRNTDGLGVILLGPDVETLEGKRDETDLPVSVEEEREEFRMYAAGLAWFVFQNKHTPSELTALVNLIISAMEVRCDTRLR